MLLQRRYFSLQVAKDSPSDDSGVEVNGNLNYDTHQMDRYETD